MWYFIKKLLSKLRTRANCFTKNSYYWGKVRIKTFEQNNNIIDIYFSFNNIEKDEKLGSLRKVIRFHLNDKTVSLNNYGYLNICKIPRDLYQKIDEWIVDFGFEK